MPALETAPPADQPLRKEDAEPEASPPSSSSHRELSVRASPDLSSLPAPVRAALELAEARRRLLEAESRRRVVSELEARAHQLHHVFLEAERRLVHRAEGLGRLGGAAAQAELQLASRGGQRLRKGLRRCRKVRPPALLASALGLGPGGCAPWADWRRRQQQQAPESPFRRRPPGPAHAHSHPATA